MKCLIFAHRGEAQEFIKKLKLKTEDQLFYSNSKDYSLIITGEGPYEVLTKLPYLIAKHNITTLINYGVAGSLDKSLELNNIYPIRTAYAHEDSAPLFHSYQCSKSGSKVDCITTFKRVLTDDFASTLSNFAQVVDRELWAIGKISKQYKIPFFAFKLISDIAGSSTKCFDLAAKAQEFSLLLWDHFSKYDKEFNHTIEDTQETPAYSFKTSFTQKKLIESLVNKISDKDFLNKREETTANKYIEALKNHLNPIRKDIAFELSSLSKPYTEIGATLEFDKNLEKESFKISMNINSQKNLENLGDALSKTEFLKFQNILNGKFDV